MFGMFNTSYAFASVSLEGSVNFQFSDSHQLPNECLLLQGTKSMKLQKFNDKFGSILFSRFIAHKTYKRMESVTEMQQNEMGSLVLLVKHKNIKLKRQDLSDINSSTDVLFPYSYMRLFLFWTITHQDYILPEIQYLQTHRIY